MMTPRKKPLPTPAKNRHHLSPAKAKASKQAGEAAAKVTENFVGAFLHRWKTYVTSISLVVTSFLIEIPDVWVALGDEISTLTSGYIEGAPKWLPWAIRGVAIVVGTIHRIKRDGSHQYD